MNHQDFDWDFENITHIARHGVTPEEAEEVFVSPTKHIGSEIEGGELRHSELGITMRGRILLLVWTERGRKVRVVAAYPPSARLKREFLAFGGM
jgi:uncharacterized DUF497 family protein